MTAPKPRIPYTYDDYCTLPEDMSRRYELLHGDLYMVPAPTTRHQRISRMLLGIIDRHVSAKRSGEVFYSPVDVILGRADDREVAQPDLVFIAEARRDIVKLHGIEGPPDLVVEIISPGTEARDRGYKLKMYARHGVREYWIVDPDTQTVEVFLSGPEDFAPAVRYAATDVLTSALFPGLCISLQEIFTD